MKLGRPSIFLLAAVRGGTFLSPPRRPSELGVKPGPQSPRRIHPAGAAASASPLFHPYKHNQYESLVSFGGAPNRQGKADWEKVKTAVAWRKGLGLEGGKGSR